MKSQAKDYERTVSIEQERHVKYRRANLLFHEVLIVRPLLIAEQIYADIWLLGLTGYAVVYKMLSTAYILEHCPRPCKQFESIIEVKMRFVICFPSDK